MEEYFRQLGLEEEVIRDMLATERSAEPLLPGRKENGAGTDGRNILRANAQILEELSGQPPESALREAAGAMLLQERLVQAIYTATCLSQDQWENEQPGGRNSGYLLQANGMALKRFRQRHPEVPGIRAGQLLEELSPWMAIFPRWNVVYNFPFEADGTLAPAFPAGDDFSAEEGFRRVSFVASEEASMESYAVPDGRQLWYHWRLFGVDRMRENGSSLYVPALPKGSRLLMNGKEQQLLVERPTLLRLPAISQEEGIEIALALPLECQGKPAMLAKFPLVVVERLPQGEGKKR